MAFSRRSTLTIPSMVTRQPRLLPSPWAWTLTTTAGVVVWENTWAAPFAAAARRAGGQLVANGRIPTQALLAAIEADDDEQEA